MGHLQHLPHLGSPKDTEGQVQANASGGRKLDLVMVERTVGEDILLDGCLHRALQREAGRWEATSTVPSAVTASGELLRHTNPALQAQGLTSGQGWLYNFPLILRKLHTHQGKNWVSLESYLLSITL